MMALLLAHTKVFCIGLSLTTMSVASSYQFITHLHGDHADQLWHSNEMKHLLHCLITPPPAEDLHLR